MSIGNKYFKILNILNFNKSIVKKVDILIWNSFNSQYILDTLSYNYTCTTLEFTKNKIDIFFSIKFIYFYLFNLINQNSLSFNYLSTNIQYLQPRLIITYLSNSPYPDKIEEKYKNIKFLSIQYTPETPDNISNKYFYYFSWASMSKIVLDKYNIDYKKIYEIGSLKLAKYLEKKESRSYYNYDIGFISTYRLLYENMDFINYSNKKTNELQKIVNCLNKLLFKINLLLKNLVLNNYTIGIALTNTDRSFKEMESEIKYYTNISKKLKLLPKENLSSYDLSENSKIILTLNSSLGFELVSLGKKVIFLIDDKEFLDISKIPWGNDDLLYNNIPTFLRCDFKVENLISKIKYLENIDNQQYNKMTEDFRNYYCLSPNNTIELFNKYINEIINT